MPNPNSVPRFLDEPRTWMVQLAAASPRATPAGGGTTFDLLTAEREGSRIDSFLLQGESDVQDSLIFIFVETPNNTSFLYDEIEISSATGGSGKSPRFQQEKTLTNPITVRQNWKLKVGTNVTTGTIDVFATGGDY